MGKILINGNQLEILTEHILLNEQTEADFKGPVGYINFKFDKEPEDYLPKSLEEWKRLKNNYLNY